MTNHCRCRGFFIYQMQLKMSTKQLIKTRWVNIKRFLLPAIFIQFLKNILPKTVQSSIRRSHYGRRFIFKKAISEPNLNVSWLYYYLSLSAHLICLLFSQDLCLTMRPIWKKWWHHISLTYLLSWVGVLWNNSFCCCFLEALKQLQLRQNFFQRFWINRISLKVCLKILELVLWHIYGVWPTGLYFVWLKVLLWGLLNRRSQN